MGRLRVNRVGQPNGPLHLNRAPLTQSISTLLPLGVDNRDIVSGNPVVIGSGGSVALDGRGKSLKGTGAGGRGSIAVDLSAFNKLTLSFWMYWDGFDNADTQLALEYTADGVSNAGIFFDPNNSNGFISIASGPIASYGNRSFARPSGAAWHHYFVTIDRSQLYGGIALCIDGVSIAPSAQAGGTPGGNFANSTLYLLSRNNASLWGLGRLQNVVLRGGYIGTAADAIAEYRNTWQLFAPIARNSYQAAAAGGGSNTAINPSVGSLALTGYAPTIAQTANQSLTPSTGTLAITGYAPTITQPQAITPGVGSLTITGYAPTVVQASASISVSPDVGVLTITGYAPTVTQSGAGGGGYDDKKKTKKQIKQQVERLNKQIVESLQSEVIEEIKAVAPVTKAFVQSLVSAQAIQQIDDEDEDEALMLLMM